MPVRKHVHVQFVALGRSRRPAVLRVGRVVLLCHGCSRRNGLQRVGRSAEVVRGGLHARASRSLQVGSRRVEKGIMENKVIWLSQRTRKRMAVEGRVGAVLATPEAAALSEDRDNRREGLSWAAEAGGALC